MNAVNSESPVNGKSELQLSSYQRAIMEFVANESGDAMVSAVAGSGKTTTLKLVASSIHSGSVLFLAFNKHIADAIQSDLVGTAVQSKTIHSVGHSALYQEFGRLRVNGDKYESICFQACKTEWDSLLLSKEGRSELATRTRSLTKLVDLSRLTLCDKDPSAISELASAHSIEADNGVLARMCEMVEGCCRVGIEQIERSRSIDFTDMVWVPVVLKLRVPKYEYLLVDESQDLNAAQRELVLMLRKDGGRMIFVGDPKQAIMGFAGADFRSYEKIKEVTGATELPLSICYRCPSSHVELAKAIVPQIESRPNAALGEINTITLEDIVKHVSARDLVLCRKVSPIVSLCIAMIRRGIPARVRGRDIAKTLVTLAEKIGESCSWSNFPQALESYRVQRTEAITRKKNPEAQLQVLNDTVDALSACYDEYAHLSLAVMCHKITDMFEDEESSVWLSTIHKAKGLEADSVFIIKPQFLPLQWRNQTAEQAEQEMNLKYVALTRARRSLTWVVDKLEAEVSKEKEV